MKKKTTTMSSWASPVNIAQVFTASMICLFFIGCGDTPDPIADLATQNANFDSREMKDAHSEFLTKLRRFKRVSEQTLKRNERRIIAFNEKMEEAGPTFKARYRNEAAVLEQRNRSLKKKLGEYNDESLHTWEKFKTGFNDDMDGVGKSMTVLFKDDG